MRPININSPQGMALASAKTGLSMQEIAKMKNQAAIDTKKKNDKKWALQELGYDEKWWDEAWIKIDKIKASLPKDMDYKQKCIKMFGWIKPTNGRRYTIPTETDQEYAHATSIELIMTNHDLYQKILNWD